MMMKRVRSLMHFKTLSRSFSLQLLITEYQYQYSPGVEQNSPTLTPGVANFECSVATAMSQLATN